MASVLPLILFRVCFPSIMGYTLVAERYVADTIVTVAYFIGDKSFCYGKMARLLLRFIPRDSIIIHLDADYKSILKRRGELVDPQSFIEFQREGYRIMEKMVRAKRIDTSNTDAQYIATQITSELQIWSTR